MSFNDWYKVRLEEVLDLKNGKSRPKEEGVIPVYGGNGILGYTNKHNVEGETLIIGRVGAYCGATYFETRPCFISDNALYAKSKRNHSGLFLYYLLKDLNLNRFAGGSSHPLLTQGRLNELEISIPSEEVQNKIANILSSIDEKIMLNNNTNATLEELATNIFQELCVSKSEELQNGWQLIKLSEFIELKNGYAFKGMDFIEEGVPVIKIKNVKAGKVILNQLSYVSREVADKAQRFRIKKNDLLITMSGNRIDGTPETWVGKVGIFHRDGEYLLNQRVSILNIIDENKMSKYFLSQLLSSEEYQYYFISNATSSGGQANISPDLIYNTEIVVPPIEQLQKFNKLTKDIYNKIFANELEIETLTKLRDSLLPKLMKGEISL